MSQHTYPFDYKIIRSKKRRKSVSIHVSPDLEVIVRTPQKVPRAIIEQALVKRTDWILTTLNEFAIMRRKIEREFIEGESLPYFGVEYPFIFTQSKKKRPIVSHKWNKFIVTTPEFQTHEERRKSLRDAFTKWYITNGREDIEIRSHYYANKLNVTFNAIRLRKVKTLWGSCSSTNNLTFNWRLVMAPAKIVDYVIIHELCHLVHRNHSKDFWQLVASFDSNYKEHRKWLKQHGWKLSF